MSGITGAVERIQKLLFAGWEEFLTADGRRFTQMEEGIKKKNFVIPCLHL
jgi:hypothetical protein